MKSSFRIVSCLSFCALLAGISGCIDVGGKTPEALPEAKEVKIELKRPMGVAVDRMDRRIIANTGLNQVIVLDKDYDPVGIIRGVTKGGLLKEPHGVASNSKNRIIVADTGNDCVKIYDENGYYKSTIGSRGDGPGEFNRPEGVATDADDNIFVFDTGNKRVQVFNKRGKYLFSFNSGEYSYEELKGDYSSPEVETIEGTIVLDHPVRGAAMPGNRLVIADYYAGKYSVWEYDAKKKTATPLRFVEPKDNYPDYLAGDVAYNPVQNEMFYLRSGHPLTNKNFLRVAGINKEEFERIPEEFRHLKDEAYEWQHFYRTSGELKIRFLEPRGVAVDSEGNVVLALAKQDRVVEFSRYEIDERINRFNPLAMRIAETEFDSFVIEYDTTENIETKLEYGQLEGDLISGQPVNPEMFTDVFIDKLPKKRHRVEIDDLFLATRYVYRYVTTNRSFPKDNFTDPYIVSTDAPRRETAYLDLPVTILLFANIVEPLDEDKLPRDEEDNPIFPDDPGGMTREQIDRVKEQLDVARLFYWVNSNLRMNIKFRYIVDNTRFEGLPFENYAYYPNKDRAKLDEILSSHDVDPKIMHGGICVIYGIRRYNYDKAEWFMPGSGGNTWGSPHDGSGICVWNAGGDNSWLFCHEYGHQLGIMGNNCGHVYHFNHFRWNDLPGDYGEHWDGNAYIAREFKPSSYLANSYGTLAVSKDSDDDGIPDDDPNVPLDEKRFGTRAYSKDSDNDRLSDFDEIQAAIWLFDHPTIGGRMVGPVYRPTGYDTDSDGDGISDGKDPYPLYAISAEVDKNSVTIDGAFSEGEWAEGTMRLIKDEKANGSFHVNWDEKYLYFGLVLEAGPDVSRPPEMRIQIDGNNDGFTVGSDNTTITSMWKEDEKSLAVKTIFSDTSIRKKPVWTDNVNPKPEDVLIAWQRVGDYFVVELGVPQTPEAGLNLFFGEEIGFNFGFKPEGSEGWLNIFEPQVLVDITLQ